MAPENPGIYTKKEGLTLSQLASYDDICTDVLVDKVSYFLLHVNSVPFEMLT